MVKGTIEPVGLRLVYQTDKLPFFQMNRPIVGIETTDSQYIVFLLDSRDRLNVMGRPGSIVPEAKIQRFAILPFLKVLPNCGSGLIQFVPVLV